MIRFAKKEDGPAVAELILIILKDMELDFLEAFSDEEVKEVVAACFCDPTYRFGYQRGLVAEIDGEIAGAAFGYPAEAESIIDLPLENYFKAQGVSQDIQMFIDGEAFKDEWYLDSIAVSEKYRGYGIGSQLLGALDQLAQRDHKKIIGLNVDQNNPAAKRLYLRQGFTKVGEMTISDHRYDHMQRKVAPAAE